MKRRLRNYRKKSGSFDSGVSSSSNVDFLHSSNTNIEVSDLKFKTYHDLRNYIKSDFKLNSEPYVTLIDVVKAKQYIIPSNEEESSDENEEMESVEKKPHLSDEVFPLADACNEDKSDIDIENVEEKPNLSNEDFQLSDTVIEDKLDTSGIESFVSRLNLGIITFNAFHKEEHKMKKIEVWNRKVNYDLIEITSDSDIFKEATNLNNSVTRTSPCSNKNAEITENNTAPPFKSESPKLTITPIKRIIVNNTERFRKSESPKLPVASLKITTTKNNERDIKKLSDNKVNVFKVPNIVRPNCKSRNQDSFKKPAVNIIQSSSINQHLRARIEAVKTMKCVLNETVSSDDISGEEENDDLLSIFAVSEFNDEIPVKQPEIIATENDRLPDIEKCIDDSKASSSSTSVILDLPKTENSPLNSSSSSSPVDADHTLEKSEEVKESDNDSQNESIVATWLSESNKISALALMKKCCWYYRDCRRMICLYYHHLPPDLENAVINSSIIELREGVKWILKVKSIALINDAVPLFIKAFSIQQCEDRLIDLIQDILHSHVDKTPHIKMIIKALSSLDGYDFSKAINEVIFTHGRRNSALTDILLNVIVDEENFIIDHWDLILNVIKGKQVLDFGVVEDVIKASLKANQKDIYIKVCKDLLMKPFVRIEKIESNLLIQLITQLNQSSLSHYSQVINNIINNSSNIQLSKPNDFHQASINTPIQSTIIFDSRIPPPVISNDLCDADIIALNKAVLIKDANSLICILNKYIRNNFVANSFITHLILISRKLKNVMHIHELLMICIKKSPSLQKFWCHIVLNLLPLYDIHFQYKAAAEIIITFPNNALSHCQCLYDEEPYRSNLKNTQEKMVFIIKLLVRANFLKDAFDLICMEEFRLNDTSNQALYEYKIKNVTEFLNKLIKADPKFCTNILHAFIYGRIKIPPHLDFWAIYNQFLMNILNAENKIIILHEIPVFQMCYKYICNSILRGFFMYLYQKTDYPNLETMYHHFSENSIYLKQNVNGDIITVQNNYTIDEIFIVIRFFLITMLHHNKAPVTLKILITQPSETTDENFVPNILKQNLCFEDRLLFAIGKFVPPLVLNRNCTITTNSVKLCLEQFRRHNNYNPENSH